MYVEQRLVADTAMAASHTASVTVDGSTILGCRAAQGGGAALTRAVLRVVSSVLQSLDAESFGGGVFATVSMRASLVVQAHQSFTPHACFCRKHRSWT